MLSPEYRYQGDTPGEKRRFGLGASNMVILFLMLGASLFLGLWTVQLIQMGYVGQVSPAAQLHLQEPPRTMPPAQPSALPSKPPASFAPAINVVPSPQPPATTESGALPSSGNVTLIAGSRTYRAAIAATTSVYTLMQHLMLAQNQPFIFTTKDYPSMGKFVESINDVPNKDNTYWMLYINGTQSQVGVSDAIVRPGDTVEWRYEK